MRASFLDVRPPRCIVLFEKLPGVKGVPADATAPLRRKFSETVAAAREFDLESLKETVREKAPALLERGARAIDEAVGLVSEELERLKQERERQ